MSKKCIFILSELFFLSQDVAIIREPHGIAVDRDLNVYVVSKGNNSVVVISPDGKRCRTMLGKSDGINNPYYLYGICCLQTL
jgi:DNA-binding beta-propeller fold protein YncE